MSSPADKVGRESADAIEAGAARWLARQDAGPLSDAEARELESWQAGDPRRLGAFVRLQAVNARLERAGALSGLPVSRPRTRQWMSAGIGIAAAIAVTAIPAWYLTQPAVETRTLSTNVGEQYRASLKDGSTVELNTATRVAVEIRPHERDIRLKSGEAVFEVAHDRSRPFVVRTEYGDVRAVGTVFSVNTLDGLKVEVTEGVVSVEKDGHQLARVSSGESFQLRPGGDMARSGGQTEAIRRSLAWRDGKIAFAGETLGEAVQTFNRYNRVRLEVKDPKVAALRVGGYFRATDPEGFAAALEQSLPVRAAQANGTIVIGARGHMSATR